MQNTETTVAWILFWLFTLISVISSFLIINHFRSTRLALLISCLELIFFVALYFFLRHLMQPLALQ